MISIIRFHELIFILNKNRYPRSREYQDARNTLLLEIDRASTEELQEFYAGPHHDFLNASYPLIAATFGQWEIVQALACKGAITPAIMNRQIQRPNGDMTLAYFLINDEVGRRIIMQDELKLAKLIDADNLNSLTPCLLYIASRKVG